MPCSNLQSLKNSQTFLRTISRLCKLTEEAASLIEYAVSLFEEAALLAEEAVLLTEEAALPSIKSCYLKEEVASLT